MRPIVIDNLLGIAPKLDPFLPVGMARTAENCDLRSGKIKALADALEQVSDTNGYNSLIYHDGAFSRGNDKHYCSWKINSYEILLSLVLGVPYKTIGSVSVELGQTRLGAPTVAASGSGLLSDTFTYFITTTRNIGGYTDESGPSSTAEITVTSQKVRITRPSISDTTVQTWNIYRMSLATGEYQFVASVSRGTTTYTDNIEDADLGASPTTWYTSDQGNDIIVDKPLTTFDGMISEPHAGMLFFWKGSTLYWTEPGYPDYCPDVYNMNFPADIKACFSYAGALAVLTAKGPFRVDGTHPELLTQSKVLGKEPCIGTAACTTPKGIGYLSDSGLVLFNLFETTVVSDGQFTEQWFKDNIDASTAFMVDNDGKTYLFHSGGVLVADSTGETLRFTTLDIIATAACVREDEGEVYYIDTSGVQKLHGGAGLLTWAWISGYIHNKEGIETVWGNIEFTGSGSVTAAVYLDETLVITKLLGWDMVRGRIVGLNVTGKYLDVRLSGTGEVHSITIRAAG